MENGIFIVLIVLALATLAIVHNEKAYSARRNQILKIFLAADRPLCGREVIELSKGGMNEGNTYPNLRRMTEEGYLWYNVQLFSQNERGRHRRHCYHLTSRGRKEAQRV